VVDVERTFVVNKPIAAVRDYLVDFAHAEQWDPGTKTCTSTSEPPVAVGSSWHNVSDFMGREVELRFSLERMEPERLTFVGKNKNATTTNDLFLMPEGDAKTVVNYKSHVEFHGIARLAGPVAQREFEKIADGTAAQLTQTLDAL